MIPIKFQWQYLPPILGIVGAIAGVTTVSGLIPNTGKADEPYAHSRLSLKRLSRINFHKIGETKYAEGVEIRINPQTTFSLHKILGSPVSFDQTTDTYEVEATGDAAMAATRVTVSYEPDPNSSYELKAFRVFVPSSLIANRK